MAASQHSSNFATTGSKVKPCDTTVLEDRNLRGWQPTAKQKRREIKVTRVPRVLHLLARSRKSSNSKWCRPPGCDLSKGLAARDMSAPESSITAAFAFVAPRSMPSHLALQKTSRQRMKMGSKAQCSLLPYSEFFLHILQYRSFDWPGPRPFNASSYNPPTSRHHGTLAQSTWAAHLATP
eukprot:5608172-Amphidinium_carterae.2